MGKAAFRWRHGGWMVAIALLAVGLLPACTDNQGPAGPTHPASQTGSTDGGVQFDLAARPGPGEDQFLVTLTLTSAGGRPIVGEPVSMSGGKLSPTRGVTNEHGQFTTVHTCDGTTATVSALFAGAPSPPPFIDLCVVVASP